ncbi:polyketide synthase type I [Kibdelosporangium aridum]|uniref:Polyketide synthase type I n=1 Tax=Kibdelosporangium aridum TaxID=2030 RepID=A0A428ZD86_KIBAR|nr:thioester reductase domain-containing protein [Kibdelosporangium aridum]RSM86042.1 polyketide synthase type I [Kibdelosporangium aridum]
MPLRETDIAVVGVGCRFPDAPTPERFWQNIDEGHVAIRDLPDEVFCSAGVSEDVLRAPDFVRAAATLAEPGDFATEFFGYSPREAGLTDPAHRLMLEVCWEALEFAGHPPAKNGPVTGIFAGAGPSTYAFALQVAAARKGGIAGVIDEGDLYLGSAPDFLTSRVAYKLGLLGPSVTIQTACSSGLTAVHYAALSLLSGECDIALAGAAVVNEPLTGYRYRPGGLLSQDGLCRSFDARSTGTSFSSGVGVVALRRLSDALTSGDPVLAVIRGTAAGNDGAERSGFTAPSPAGVASVLSSALRAGDVAADQVRYVEAHGSGTALGDQIELRGIIDAIGKGEECGLGSVKTNIGHCGPAAGIAGLIKAINVARTGNLPPHPLFEVPRDPGVLADSRFFVSAKAATAEDPYVLVNSMGLGGTIASAVLAPPPQPTRPSAPERDVVRLVLSARNRRELDAMSRNLADELDRGDLAIGDVEYTLRVGRRAFEERRVVTAPADKLSAALRLPRPPAVRTARVSTPGEPTSDPYENWLRGLEVDWEALSEGEGRRVRLPSYPFSRRRFWAIDEPVAAVPVAEIAQATDDVEASLLELWRELFGVNTIGVDDEFGSLGGTSLLSVRMALEIQDRHGAIVNVHRAGGSKATVRRIAEIIRGQQPDQVADGDSALADADIELPLGPVGATGMGTDVLLTGATGFLGAFLLHELQQATSERIHCVVRAADETEAWQRLRNTATRYELPEPEPDRVSVIPADLKDIGKHLTDELARDVGHVLHCANKVVFTEPYRVLRHDNVLPMAELLRWMRRNGVPEFSFVSSTAATGYTLGESHKVMETRQQPLDPGEGGYGVGKWVCERILERAEKDGMRVRIFRPGFILGSRETGACNPSDMIWRLITSGLTVGAHPTDERAWPMAPVDVVAKAIAELSRVPGSVGRAYHLIDQTATGPKRLFELLSEAGMPTRPMDRGAWRELVAQRANGNEVLSSMALYELDGYEDDGPNHMQAVAWRPWLAESGLDSAVSGDLLRRCLKHLADRYPTFQELLPL